MEVKQRYPNEHRHCCLLEPYWVKFESLPCEFVQEVTLIIVLFVLIHELVVFPGFSILSELTLQFLILVLGVVTITVFQVVVVVLVAEVEQFTSTVIVLRLRSQILLTVVVMMKVDILEEGYLSISCSQVLA